MKKSCYNFLLLFIFLSFYIPVDAATEVKEKKKIDLFPQPGLVVALKKVDIPGYPTAFNPTLIETEKGLLLTFRWVPDLLVPWNSYIGLVFVDAEFNPISEVQLLNTRSYGSIRDSQAEDARLFAHQGALYVVYNDNPYFVNPTSKERRDMYLAKLELNDNGSFSISKPVKLYHQTKYGTTKWQKNWVPFEWEGALLFAYSIQPHEILAADLDSGTCFPLSLSSFSAQNEWKLGQLRGGTPASLVDGEYLAFFHSSAVVESSFSDGEAMYHYFMGAYTFSSEPPFEITKIMRSPLMARGMYTQSSFHKRVVFPGSYIVKGRFIHLAYGKDDSEMWIATLDRKRLAYYLKPVTPIQPQNNL